MPADHMEFELCLAPESAARLSRVPTLASAAKLRGQAVRIVWHDSPDAMLAAEGLTLAQERGVWRLERLIPGTAPIPWPPGAPAPVQAQAPSLEGLNHAMPAAIPAVAAFVGRRNGYVVETDEGTVTLWAWRGALRAVENERPACRLCLSGPDAAIRGVALTLAETLPVAVPRGTLAAEGVAAARGAVLPARRLGAPAVPEGLDVGASFAWVVGHLTDVILHFAPAAAADTAGPEPVHQMRVAVRRLRSALTIYRRALDSPELASASADLKALGQRLGPTRDWDVFLGETAPAVCAAFPSEPRLTRMLTAAKRQRQTSQTALRDFLRGPAFRRMGISLAWLAGSRSWLPAEQTGEEPVSLPEFAALLLEQRLGKLLTTGEEIEALDTEGLHGLRLRAKRTRYAAEIFAPLYPPKHQARFVSRLGALQDRLGVMNDGATAATLLAQLGPKHTFAAGLVLGFIGAGTTELRPRIMKAWERFRKTPGFWE